MPKSRRLAAGESKLCTSATKNKMDSRFRGNDEHGLWASVSVPVPVASSTTPLGRANEGQCWWRAITAIATFTLALMVGNPAHAQAPPGASAEEIQAKQKLDDVRAEIRRISEAQKQAAAEKNETTAALRSQELKIAATAKDVRSLDQKLEGQQTRLTQMNKDAEKLNASLGSQRDALAALLRSAYMLGRNEELRLLLAHDDIGSVSRLLAYYRYFERARIVEIERLLTDLQALARVQESIETETQKIRETRNVRAQEQDQLESERGERRQVLATLEATLHDQQSRLNALGKDEKGLLQLLEKLKDVFADIPKQIAGAEPFAQLRGQLSMPLHGKLQSAAAEEGDSHGVLIAAADGGEVHAVSHGRVVFADWLRGYGLLLIVDHGDAYLSLYGCNETLLKDVGDWVDANEIIATSGSSGGRSTPGLYFELRHDGKPMDARAWLRTSHAH